MGRIDQAMRRARQSGIATEFEPMPASAYDISVLAAEPFPPETTQAPAEAAQEAPIAKSPAVAAPSATDDKEIRDIFFNTYPEKVWGREETLGRLNSFLEKVERKRR